MKLAAKFLALLTALILLCSTGAAFAQTFYSRQIDYCNDYVTLRSKPSGSASAVAYVDIGEVVMAAPYNSEFSYCCYDGKYGYIKSQYLSSYITTWSEGTFRVANCNEWISLRDMPLTNGNVRARIPLGAQLDAVYYHDGNNTKFVYVKYNGQCGFVQWQYLEPVYYYGWQ